ncbi:hypothetical protein [Rhodococcus sp. NPDC058521]|uniref:hypothetical protein n=1 Tax=Rhodococcus sp. NPDC058521 TaxID=3346536 RepID=UPI0036636735
MRTIDPPRLFSIMRGAVHWMVFQQPRAFVSMMKSYSSSDTSNGDFGKVADTGVTDHDVDLTELGDSLVDGRLNLVALTDIGHRCDHLAAHTSATAVTILPPTPSNSCLVSASRSGLAGL